MKNGTDKFGSHLIPFYGGQHPEMFEIERRCMDRQGLVIDYLDRELPQGIVLDIGAGNGFTASQLSSPSRQVVALEPDSSMVELDRDLVWTRGVAQDLPFHDDTFDAAYATWAYFFDNLEIDVGLAEAARVTKPGGRVHIVLNAGDDEFCSFADQEIASDSSFWKQHGFETTLIHTHFEFDDLDEARRLLSFYFGEESAESNTQTKIEFDVAVYSATAIEIAANG